LTRIRVALAILFLLALGLRTAAYVHEPKPVAGAGLAAVQAEMARNIVHHDKWFVVNDRALTYYTKQQDTAGKLIDPAKANLDRFDRGARYTSEVLEMPGLAVLLSGIWSVTGSDRYVEVQWLQIILDSVLTLLVYWIVMSLSGSRRASFLSAALYACWPGALISDVRPSIDTWAIFVTIATTALYLRARDEPRATWLLVLLGAVIGVGIYFRPFVLLLPVLLALVEARRRGAGRTMRTIAVPVLVALVVLTPWTIRNYAEFHRFIPTRSGLGQALWEGLGERKNSFGAQNDDQATEQMVHRERPALEYGTPAYDSYLLTRSRHAIASEPIHYATLILLRALFLLPCLGVFLLPRGNRRSGTILAAVALATILPYIFIRIETRFWLPAAFAYIALGALIVDSRVLSRLDRKRLQAGTAS